MRKLVALLTVLALQVALATHFTGTYVDQQNGVTFFLQMQQDGTIQGTLTGPSGNFQLQGQGNEQGAFGTAQSTQGALGFQAQLNQDDRTLQVSFFQADQNNQPVQVGGLVLQRSGAAVQPGMGQPGMGQSGQMPVMTQPGAAQPGMPGGAQPAFPTAPHTGLPGTQPGLPGAAQPTFPTAPAGPPNAGLPGTPQTRGGGGLGGGMGGGQSAAPQTGDWNGAYSGNAGQLVMFIQPTGQQGSYTGYFEVSGQQFQLQASGGPEAIEGAYLYNGSQVPFYAENYGTSVYLVDGSDGTEYLLERGTAAPR